MKLSLDLILKKRFISSLCEGVVDLAQVNREGVLNLAAVSLEDDIESIRSLELDQPVISVPSA